MLEPKLGPAEKAPQSDGDATDDLAAGEYSTLSWKSYRWGMSTVWLENVLSKQPARWLPPGYSDYGALLTAAVENTLKQTWGADQISPAGNGAMNYWVEIDHPLLKNLPLIGRFTGSGRHPLSGDHYTVRAVDHSFGPSERLTWNFADFDTSTLNVVTGQSGVFLSQHYLDQWPAWYGGSTFILPFSAEAVAQHRMHELTLAP